MKRIIIKYIGFILVFLGIVIPLFQFSEYKIVKNKEIQELEEKINNESYFMVLEIPKIKLKKELVEIESEDNHVDKNIYLHPSSSLPGNITSNIILASHSGYGMHAYFQNLYKLKLQDEVIIYYLDNIYTYVILEKEVQEKNGFLSLKKEYKDMITLITCTKNNDFTQDIYYGKLKNVQKSEKSEVF